jgi:hypothetical protein
VHLKEDEKGVERMIAYGSRSCNPAESRYSSFEGKLLAAVYFVRLWRPGICMGNGSPTGFVLESDHQPLKWILTSSKLTGKLARWALMLSEFDSEVRHGAGVDNEIDCLSRYPQVSNENCTRVRQEGELDGVAPPIWSTSMCLSWQPIQLKGTAVDVVEACARMDVWADEGLLAVLRGNGYPPGSGAAEKDRLQHRANNGVNGHEWREDIW